MNLIKKCKSELKALQKCKSIKDRRKLLRKADKCVIDSISEISKNFLLGNLELSKNKKIDRKKIDGIRKYKKAIEFISDKKPVEKRRVKIIQKGGYLNLLIPASLILLEKFLKNV